MLHAGIKFYSFVRYS